MSDREYTLLLGDVELGKVRQKDADFPGAWGEFVPSDLSDHPELRERIRQWAEYTSELNQMAREDAITEGFEQEHAPRFIDLIQSKDWWMVDGEGKRHPILIPDFCGDHVAWRWDPLRLKGQGGG